MARQAFDIKCKLCLEVSELFEEIIGYNVPVKCPSCGGVAFRCIASPSVMGKAAYRDGHKRTGWEDLKKAAHLEVEANKLPPEQRGEILQEKRDREQSAKNAIEKKIKE